MSDTINDSNELDNTLETAPEVKVEAPVNIRDAIEQAYEKLDTTTEAAPAPEKKKTALPVQDATEAKTVVETDKEVDPISGRTLEPIRSPEGMPPAIREKWGTLDRQVQQYWSDREKDVQQTLSKTANERKLANEFKEIAAPYEGMLRQFNITAADHTKELFNLSYSLNNGTPQTKAQVLYNLITHFKPDPATLQALFAGQQVAPAAQVQAPINVQAEVEKALAARQEAEETKTVESAVSAFRSNPANEFYADVAPLMGKIIDAGLVDGADYTTLFQNAYELACQRTPEIKAILDSRSNAPAARQNAATAAQTPKPVPQVKPSLNGGIRNAAPAKAMSARQAAEAAFEKLTNKQ